MPNFLKPIVQVIPSTYLADAQRQIMVGSNPLRPLALDAPLIAAWMALCMLVAVRFFEWEQKRHRLHAPVAQAARKFNQRT
jgi:ABC-2 type transport system permease protein